jgi:WD40 repeat protein
MFKSLICPYCSLQNPIDQRHCQGCGELLRLNDRYSMVRSFGRGVSQSPQLSSSFNHQTYLGLDWHSTPPSPCVLQQNWNPGQWKESLLQQLTALGTHPQLPIVLDCFEDKGMAYLVQEYRTGENLGEWMQHQGLFCSLPEIAIVLQGVLPLLQWIHGQNILHGDIKPENILTTGTHLTPDRLVLVDWGNARWHFRPEERSAFADQSDRLANPSLAGEMENVENLGSAEYTAPEQLAGQATCASDLYSLGITCLRLLTGISSFQLFDVNTQNWVWRSFYQGDLTPPLNNLALLLDRLIEPKLDQRLATAAEALEILHKIVPKILPKISGFPRTPQGVTLRSWHCRTTLMGYTGHSAAVNVVVFSPHRPWLASGSDDRTLRLWDTRTGHPLAVLQAHAKPVRAIAFDPQQPNHCVSSGNDRLIHLWEMGEILEGRKSEQTDIDQSLEIKLKQTLEGHHYTIHCLAYGGNPGGDQERDQQLASGSADKTIKLWKLPGYECEVTLVGHRLSVNTIAFSTTQPLLASGSSDTTVKIWDLTNRSLVATLMAHTAAVNTIAFSPNGQLLATAGDDRTIQLWDTQDWKRSQVLSGHAWPVSALAFSGDGRHLLSASWDQTVKIWDVRTAETIGILSGHQDSITTLAIDPKAPNYLTIATGSRDQTIKLWY